MKRYFYLKRVDITHSLGIIPFKSKTVILGRSPTCDFCIPDPTISRHHALFDCRDDFWYIKNLSSSGISLNGKSLCPQDEKSFALGDLVQFGPSPEYLYKFSLKEVDEKTIKNRDKEQQSLSDQQDVLLKKLQQSNSAKDILLKEKEQLQDTFRSEKKSLELKWSDKLIELEKVHQDGLSAHMSLLQEKENLANQLKNEMKQMELRVEENRTKLEDQLKKEEEIKNGILEEKVLITAALQAEKNALEEELKRMEEAQVAIVTRMEDQAQSLQEKVNLQQKTEKEQQKEAEALKVEQAAMRERLLQVENSLEEKTELTSALKIELDKKAITEERVNALLGEKEALKKRLDEACKNNDEEVVQLKESLREMEDQKLTLEAEKLSMEAAPIIENLDEKEKIVSSVTNVLENELQCPICNELFVTAIMLNCSHTFCKFCINKWKETKCECPNCRTRIMTETRSLVVDNFIDRIVETLSEELKNRRKLIIAEREKEIAAELAAKQAAALAAAARAAEQRGRNRGRGRGRARGAAGRNRGRGRAAANRPVVPLATIPVTIAVRPEEPVIDLTDVDTSPDFSHSDSYGYTDSDMSDEEINSYHGGYGACFICGSLNHWANGCPLRY